MNLRINSVDRDTRQQAKLKQEKNTSKIRFTPCCVIFTCQIHYLFTLRQFQKIKNTTHVLETQIIKSNIILGQRIQIVFLVTDDTTVIDSYKDSEEEVCEDICPNAVDLTQCARDYFDKESTGSVVWDADNEPVIRGEYNSFSSILNVTFITHNTEIGGVNGTVTKFW